MMAATDRALEAMLALDADESKPSASETQTADLQSLPTVDERVDMFLRALHGPERDFSGAERAIARRWILDAMAADLAGETDTEDFEGNANTVAASPQIPLSATTSTQSR